MIRDMTIGQFYNVDSVIHRLDPRVKIVITFVYIITLFIARNPYLYLMAFLGLFIYIKLSKVPLKYIFKGLKALGLMITFTVLLNLFTVRGADIILQWKVIRITQAGLLSAIYLGLRLIFMIIGSSMMTYTTTPTSLTDGFERLINLMK